MQKTRLTASHHGVHLKTCNCSNVIKTESDTILFKDMFREEDHEIVPLVTTSLVAKLIFVMQIIHCARVNIQSFHRIFALFISRSCSEPMSCDNLFHSVEAEGFGLTDLLLWQIVSRFLFLKDQKTVFWKLSTKRSWLVVCKTFWIPHTQITRHVKQGILKKS